MPYSGKYYRGRQRKSFRKSALKFGKRYGPGVYRKMKAIAKAEIKKVTNVEYKYQDVTVSSVSVADTTTSGSTRSLVDLIDQGITGDGDRVGRQVKVVSIDVSGTILGNIASGGDQRVKVGLWVMKDVDKSTLPTYEDLYDLTVSNGNALSASNRINAKRNMDKTHNFRNLSMFECICSQEQKMVYKFHFYKKCSFVLKWDELDDEGLLINLQKNLIFLNWISNIASENYPAISWVARLKYVDN